MTTTIQPELALLLCCARIAVSGETAAQMRALAGSSLDWEAFANLARGHGVVPLVYRSLTAHCADLAPASELARFRGAVLQRIQHGMMLLGEQYQLLHLFTELDIPIIPLKGPVLGVMAYGDPNLRESGDLDLLLHEYDIPRAKALLLARGYISVNVHEYSESQTSTLRHLHHHESFYREDSPLAVELHWRLAEFPLLSGLREETLWDCCRLQRMSGHDVRVLPWAELLLFLCAHGAKHRWWHLKWICDVAEICRANPDLDWEHVLARAKTTGNLRMLLLGIILAHDLLGAPTADAVLRQAHDSGVIMMLAADVKSQLSAVNQAEPLLLDRLLFQIHAKERLIDRGRLALQRMITPAGGDWEAVSLPPIFSFLYWFVRPFRLLKRYGRHCLRQMLRQTPTDDQSPPTPHP